MALFTIDGVYENGRIELTEIPAGVQRANVRVTFLLDAPSSGAATKSIGWIGNPIVGLHGNKKRTK